MDEEKAERTDQSVIYQRCTKSQETVRDFKRGKSGLTRSAIGERSCSFSQGGRVVDPRGRKGKDPKSWIDQATELKALTVRQ